jgi:dTDP-glucose 4,6-dehydratase
MVYGHGGTVAKREDHPREPLGPYGASKIASEKLCESYREKGMNITIFRPRLIMGPSRLGILVKLFRLIDHSMPVPVIGDGRNRYQFISVFDCIGASLAAVDAGVPNAAYNLGSLDPPTVWELLTRLIEEAGSRSFVLPTPAALAKRVLTLFDILGLPLMAPEQYLIADETCIVDISKAERELGWRPQYRDDDMLLAAYREYRRSSAQPETTATAL